MVVFSLLFTCLELKLLILSARLSLGSKSGNPPESVMFVITTLPFICMFIV